MGQFTTIIGVDAPVKAAQGDTVAFNVRVQALNYWGDNRAQWIAVTGKENSTSIIFVPAYSQVAAMQIKEFVASFIMPNKGVMVSYGSWVPYLSNGVLDDWHIEDQGSVGIALDNGNGNGEEPPDDEEESWFEKNTLLVVGGLAAVTVLGVVVLRR